MIWYMQWKGRHAGGRGWKQNFENFKLYFLTTVTSKFDSFCLVAQYLFLQMVGFEQIHCK